MYLSVKYMPKFKTKTYQDAVEMAAKMITVDGDGATELAMIAFIYSQHPHKVMTDIAQFHKRWAKLVNKPLPV